MEKLMNILQEARPDIDFKTAKELIDAEILDSFDIISIVSDINEAFHIEININDLSPENFNSADAIYALIQKLQDTK